MDESVHEPQDRDDAFASPPADLSTSALPERPPVATSWWAAADNPGGTSEQPALAAAWRPAEDGPEDTTGLPPATRAPLARRALLRAGSTGAAVVLAAAATGIVVHHVDQAHVAAAATTTVPAAASVASVQSALSKAERSVVIINDTITETTRPGGFGGQSGVASAAGTGIVISPTGEVVTNAHVVNGATSIKVTLPDGSVHSATIVGLNATKDLAVIKVAGVSGLTPATFANSTTANVGDSVIAIGNAEGYGGAPSVTEGILSAKDRSLSSSESGSSNESLTGLLQTDAAINPGNSGGPLVDAAGDVLGIDTAVAAGTSTEPAQNIGFVIPSNAVVAAIPALEQGASVGQTGAPGAGATGAQAVLGVEVSDDASGSGAVVQQVQSGSGAANAGLQAGDVIVGIDGARIASARDLSAVIGGDAVGQTVRITLTRNGSTQTARATLGAAS